MMTTATTTTTPMITTIISIPTTIITTPKITHGCLLFVAGHSNSCDSNGHHSCFVTTTNKNYDQLLDHKAPTNQQTTTITIMTTITITIISIIVTIMTTITITIMTTNQQN